VTLMGAAALAQPATSSSTSPSTASSTTTYIDDINGRRVEASSIQSSDHTTTERWQAINGRSIPLEQVEEHVIQEGPGIKKTERLVKKFSPTGEQTSTERIVTEEQKTTGASTVHETVWRSDINGNLRQDEQRTTETRGTGSNTTTETTIARPTINGSAQVVEKRSATSTGTDAAWKSSETVYRLSGNGGMYEALRQVTESTKQKDRSTANTTYYEPGVSGSLVLARQSVSTTLKAPDGSETTEVNLYARAADGRVQENGAPQQIKEQQIIERRKKSDGSVIETLSVRRPSLADPTHLGGPQEISETVCKGKCD
jgi:hypothetical protein